MRQIIWFWNPLLCSNELWIRWNERFDQNFMNLIFHFLSLNFILKNCFPIEFVALRFFIYSTVRQVHLNLFRIVFINTLIFLTCNSPYKIIININYQGINRSDREINSKVDLFPIKKKRIVDVSLDHCTCAQIFNFIDIWNQLNIFPSCSQCRLVDEPLESSFILFHSGFELIFLAWQQVTFGAYWSLIVDSQALSEYVLTGVSITARYLVDVLICGEVSVSWQLFRTSIVDIEDCWLVTELRLEAWIIEDLGY